MKREQGWVGGSVLCFLRSPPLRIEGQRLTARSDLLKGEMAEMRDLDMVGGRKGRKEGEGEVVGEDQDTARKEKERRETGREGVVL